MLAGIFPGRTGMQSAGLPGIREDHITAVLPEIYFRWEDVAQPGDNVVVLHHIYFPNGSSYPVKQGWNSGCCRREWEINCRPGCLTWVLAVRTWTITHPESGAAESRC